MTITLAIVICILLIISWAQGIAFKAIKLYLEDIGHMPDESTIKKYSSMAINQMFHKPN